MQPIGHEPEVLKGLEILNFGQVELEKVRGDGAHTFATVGNLSVFYFDYFERFVLQLNNWRYCLMPRLPTLDATHLGADSRDFVMPAYDGTYTIKLNQILNNPAAIQNFETILRNATKFNHEGLREPAIRQDEVTFGEIARSQVVYPDRQAQEMAYTSYPSTYSSTMQSSANSDVKKSKLKMSLSKMKQKFGRKQKVKKQPNLNMTQVRDFQSIKATPETMVNILEFRRQEVEAAIVSTKEIIKKIEVSEQTLTEEVKEKVVNFFDVVKEGVHDIKEKLAERHEHEAQTGEKIGVMEIVKEGINEMKDKLTGKGHLDDGEIEPMEDRERAGTAKKSAIAAAIMAGVNEFKSRRAEKNANEEGKPGIIDTVKNSVNDLKGRATLRHELAGDHVEKIGIMDIVKEGVLEIKEKLAKKDQEEVVVTEKVETIVPGVGTTTTVIQDRVYEQNLAGGIHPNTVGVIQPVSGVPIQETRLGQILVNEPPRVYESIRTHEGRLKIFDDKYLDQPLHAKPFPITGEAGKDMVIHYDEYSRPAEPVAVEYKVDNSHLNIIDRIKASLPASKPSHLPVKETTVPEGHASSNISDRLKDFAHIKPSTTKTEPETKLSFVDQIKAKIPFISGVPQHEHTKSHSPMKKRELIRAALPMFSKNAEPEATEVEAGTLGNFAQAGGLLGVSGVTGMFMKNKSPAAATTHQGDTVGNTPQAGFVSKVKDALPFGKAPVHEPVSQELGVPSVHVVERPVVQSTNLIHQTPIYDQPIVDRHLPEQIQPNQVIQQNVIGSQVVQPNVVESQTVQQNLAGRIPVQSRVVERIVEAPSYPQSQVSSQVTEQVYEHYLA